MLSLHICGASTYVEAPHVEAPQCGCSTMWRLHICWAPWLNKMQFCATMVVQNANLRFDGCAKCKFAQRRLRKMQICATILQIYSNLQGAEVVPPPKEVVVL